MRRIITLTTDFGYTDYYVGILKGKIFSNIQDCNVVDITHGIKNFRVTDAGFVLSMSYNHFPKGSIHIISVSSAILPFSSAICVLHQGHYFIGTDNGAIAMAIGTDSFEEAVAINHAEGMNTNDVFVYCAYQLCEGKPLSSIGQPIESIYRLNLRVENLTIKKNLIVGTYVYEDKFGNLITNISKELFDEVGKGRDFGIRIRNRTITKINRCYADFNVNDQAELASKAGELLALFNEVGQLVVGIMYSKINEPGGSIRTLLGVNLEDQIYIEFREEEE